MLLLLSTKKRTLSTTTSDQPDLRSLLRSIKENDRAIICASNHTTFIDAPILGTMIGRALSKSPFLWPLDPQSWPVTAASATLLFAHPITATFISLLGGFPLQPKWASRGVAQPADLFALNESQYLPDILAGLARGRPCLIFPEVFTSSQWEGGS
jgi:1-acyl-sn-glycerol-3-phosphate acyltransferase